VKRYLSALTLAVLLAGGSQVLGADKKEVVFGALEAMSVEDAQAKSAAWLKSVGKTDAASQQRFQAIWKQEDRTVLDMVSDTLALGDPAAAALLADARNPNTPAPTKVPDLLKDAKNSVFFRANLGLAYARALSNRRVHEESLDVLKISRPEQVVDPMAYLFHRSVAEHALLNKSEATQTIIRLLDDGVGSPERYKTVSALMLLDMQTWKDKDLGSIARKMENIERRLDLARGGPQTQKIQKEVIMRLDELIKELENKAKKKPGSGGGDPNGGGCPDGGAPGSGPPNGNNPSSPATESGIANQGGTGRVDPVKMRKLVEEWGKMPPREQARALQELTQGMSARHREAIENYFRNLALGAKR
jgi:hypothetical protein